MYCHVRPSIYVKSEASNRIRRMQFSISFGFRSQYHQRTKRTLIPCSFRAPFSVISSNIGNAIATVHYCISKSVFRTHIQYYEYAKALFHFIHRQWVHDGISERVDLCVSLFLGFITNHQHLNIDSASCKICYVANGYLPNGFSNDILFDHSEFWVRSTRAKNIDCIGFIEIDSMRPAWFTEYRLLLLNGRYERLLAKGIFVTYKETKD